MVLPGPPGMARSEEVHRLTENVYKVSPQQVPGAASRPFPVLGVIFILGFPLPGTRGGRAGAGRGRGRSWDVPGAGAGAGTGRGAPPRLARHPRGSPGTPGMPGPGVGSAVPASPRSGAAPLCHKAEPSPSPGVRESLRFSFLLCSRCPEKMQQLVWFNFQPKEAVSALLGLETKTNETAVA